MWKQVFCAALLAHASCGVRAAAGTADAYPSKPIRMIDGFAPGGSADYMGRVMGPKLTERFGQPILVDNRPGAAGNLGAEIAARATPDGYTLLLGAITALSPSRTLYPKLGYDLLKDFSYITLVATGPIVLVTHPSIPARSVSELVAIARSQPKAMRYGSSGIASPGHLAMELLMGRTGMQLLHIPYKGGAPSVMAIVGGDSQIAFASVTAVESMIQTKRLNALAVSGPKRMAVLPEVPTVAESGVPGFSVLNIFGLLAPAGTPAAIVRLLNAEIRNILQMEEIKAKFATQGLEAEGSTPEQLKTITEAETSQWARVIKEAHISVN